MATALDRQLALLEGLRPLTRSESPYTALWSVVTSRSGLAPADEKRLRARDRNAGRSLQRLQGGGLIARKDGRWHATRGGRELVRALERAVDSSPGDVLAGCRLLSVAADSDGSLEVAERLLVEADGELLHADGVYELIAVLPDDPSLVHDLREQLNRSGHRVSTTRILGGLAHFAP